MRPRCTGTRACVAAFGIPYDQCRWRDVSTLSGGEQKRLVLESLLRGTDGVLLLDEPDNYLDVPGKRWLEQQLATTPKTVLLVSHDRELLAACAQRIVTVEDRHVWVHGGGFSGLRQGPRRTGSAGWRNCAAAGMRSTRSSRSWSAPTGRRPPTTPIWRPGCRPP